jgi:hypothetical protein
MASGGDAMIPTWIQEWAWIAFFSLGLGMLAGSKYVGW